MLSFGCNTTDEKNIKKHLKISKRKGTDRNISLGLEDAAWSVAA